MTLSASISPADATTEPVRWQQMSAISLATGGLLLGAALATSPSPQIAYVHDGMWTTGHLLSSAAYLLLLLGMPSVATTLGRRIGVFATIGVAAFLIRFALSSGSQLFYVRITPVLAGIPAVQGQLGNDGRLADVYGGWGDAFNVVLGIGMLGLVIALWRADRALRIPAAVLFVGAMGEAAVLAPVALPAFVIAFLWLGLRLLRGGLLRTARS